MNYRIIFAIVIFGLMSGFALGAVPMISNPTPIDGAYAIKTNSSLSFNLSDPDNSRMNVTVSIYDGSTWKNIQTLTNRANGIVTVSGAGFITKSYQDYTWRVNVIDATGESASATYTFKTGDLLKLKWTNTFDITSMGEKQIFPVMGDIDKDGVQEIVFESGGYVRVLNGNTGAVEWSKSGAADVSLELADLDNDGTPEVIAPMAGLRVRAYNGDGSIRWTSAIIPGTWQPLFPVASYDIDGDGYPTIYYLTQDAHPDPYSGNMSDYTAELVMMDHNGQILKRTHIMKPCWGGVSIADTNSDGKFEIYLSDRRDAYHGIPAEGLQAYDAETLELLWSRPDIQHSSPIAIVADVYEGGDLEVVAQKITNAGPMVLNATNGETYADYSTLRLPTHATGTVYDVDKDDNLEILLATSYSTTVPLDFSVFDLVDGTLDFKPNMSMWVTWAPSVGGVTRDGEMQILAAIGRQEWAGSYPLLVYDSEFNLIDNISLSMGQLSPARVFDVDNDGLNEVVLAGVSGRVSVYDTEAPTPDPAPRTWTQYYSEYRQGAAEYVPMPGPAAPVIKDENPLNDSADIKVGTNLSVKVFDFQKDNIDIKFELDNGSGWNTIRTFSNQKLDKFTTFTVTPSLTLGLEYKWRVTATDSEGNSNIKIYQFMTRSRTCVDADGDGYNVTGYACGPIDCNDNSTAIRPNAVETCDGIDNDCDGGIDEGLSANTYYQDLDADTFGNLLMNLTSCMQPAGYVSNNTDCNDNSTTINPGATEACGNLVDDNCNGVVDENCQITPAIAGWKFRKAITIDHNMVAGNLDDFPVLVDITDSDLANDAQPDGDDILFTRIDGTTILSHEIEAYNAGHLTAWVKTDVSTTTDTIIYMYYGNSTVNSRESPLNVWDDNYLAVHHMEETSGNALDSNDGNHGTNLNGVTQNATGKIGNAYRYDGVDDRTQLPQVFTNQNTFTIEAWINTASKQGYIISQRDTASHGLYMQFYPGETNFQLSLNNIIVKVPTDANKWQYVVATYDGTTASISTNGQTPITSSATLTWPNLPTLIGDRNNLGRAYSGTIDEIKISDNVRSAAYITTSYNNQNGTPAFFTVNAKEAVSGNVTPIICIDNDGDGYGLNCALGNDCNDNNAAINPAAAEVCSNSVDDNCNGNIDENCQVTPALAGWKYRKPLTIDHTKVSGNLDDFPVLIDTTDTDLANNAQPDGDDIIFTKADGTTILSHEIEAYNAGHLTAWVKMDVSTSTDTKIYMYYGNNTKSNQEDASNVWDPDFLAVHHMEETSGTVDDSTANNNDGTPQNGVVQNVAGKIDGADQFDGVNDRTELPKVFDSETQFTIEGWIYSGSKQGYILSQRDTSSNGVFMQYYSAESNVQLFINSNSIKKAASANAWHYVVATFDGATSRLYVDGTSPVTGTSTVPVWPDQSLYLGDRSNGGRAFMGTLDDIRLSKIARSQDYITTSYNNQNDPQTFMTKGGQEAVSGNVNPIVCIDNDDDGYGTNCALGNDCNDNNPDVHPDAAEICGNGIDDDCDGSIDEGCSAGLPLAGWDYRKAITIDHNMVAGNLNDFPVLVDITDSDLANDAQPDGDDILFTRIDGTTILSHEIEAYNAGHLTAWVKTDVSTTTDTIIYMYYGNSTVSSRESPSGVWDNNYLAVHHMEETSGNALDSNDGNHGTNLNGVTQDAAGKIGNAYRYDGVDDRTQMPQVFTNQNTFTIEAWINTASKQGYIISQRDTASNGIAIQFYPGETNFQMLINNAVVKTPTDANKWQYLVATYDGTTASISTNGQTPITSSATLTWPNIQTMIGDRNNLGRAYSGTIDEIKISNMARTQEYITTSYNNQNNTAGFISIGAVEN